jgi:hypothetical protein
MEKLPAGVRAAIGLFSGLPFALAYGALARLFFDERLSSEAFSTLSVAFLVLVPVAVGALAVRLGPPGWRTSWLYALAVSMGSCLLGAVLAGLLALEAAICIAMALPILLVMGAVGGLAMCALERRAARKGPGPGAAVLGLFLLAPLLVAPVERQVPVPDAHGGAESEVLIRADADTVWQSLLEVPEIQATERRFSLLFDVFGVPRPRRALLEVPGPGGLRRGEFEQNLSFVEVITDWRPARRIAWDITVGPREAVPAPWNGIGGRAFDVTGAAYTLESQPDGTVRLRLASSYRLSTRFNGYGARWVEWGLGEFQDQVLAVIQARAEAAAAGPGTAPAPRVDDATGGGKAGPTEPLGARAARATGHAGGQGMRPAMER